MYLWNIFDILFESAPNDFEFEIYTLLGLKKQILSFSHKNNDFPNKMDSFESSSLRSLFVSAWGLNFDY